MCKCLVADRPSQYGDHTALTTFRVVPQLQLTTIISLEPYQNWIPVEEPFTVIIQNRVAPVQRFFLIPCRQS